MTCDNPVSWAELARYWAGDLEPGESDRLEEHLFGCERCSAESARVAAVALAVRDFVPPVVSREMLAFFRGRGLRIEENAFLPNQRRSAHFGANLDLLIHRLTGFDLSHAERVGISVRSESTGEVFLNSPDVPFSPSEGVLIACQRHFEDAPHDIVFEVRASIGGEERLATYPIPHVFE